MIPVAIASIIAAIAIPSALQLNREGHTTIATLIIVPVAFAVVAAATIAMMSTTPERPWLGPVCYFGAAAVVALFTWLFGWVVLRGVIAVFGSLVSALPALYGVKTLCFDVTCSIVLWSRGRLKSSVPIWISAAIAGGCFVFSGLIFLGAWVAAPPSWHIGLLVWMGLVGLVGIYWSLRGIEENVKDHANEYRNWIRN